MVSPQKAKTLQTNACCLPNKSAGHSLRMLHPSLMTDALHALLLSLLSERLSRQLFLNRPSEAQASSSSLVLPSVNLSKRRMGSETTVIVEVEGIPFPKEITISKPLSLVGHGITDIEIHFLQIKYNAIGIYLEKDNVLEHLENWKGKKTEQLVEDDAFFQALVSAPVEKLFRIVVIKEIKGSQYGVQLESSVRDRLVSVDKYEDEEEEALEKVTDFFQSKYLKPNSVVTFHFPTTPGLAEISFATEGKGEAKMTVENTNVAEMIQRWYLGGTSAVSPTTVKSLADHFAALLSP